MVLWSQETRFPFHFLDLHFDLLDLTLHRPYQLHHMQDLQVLLPAGNLNIISTQPH